MMNTIGRLVGACAAAGTLLLTVGFGSAGADPDVIGKTYGEAKGLFGQAGMTPVVATVVGDRVEQDQCYVVSMTKRTPLNSSGDAAAYNQVQVNLNCYVGQSDTRTPGFSKGNVSPEAVAARATHEESTRVWKASDQGQKWCASFEAEHPEWAPIPDCHPEDE